MPRLIIDHQEIEVPAGTRVIEAAARLGIIIPRFCFHPALGALGACRVCAVKFLEGPVKGIAMSCMQVAREGMVVSTTDAEVVAFRRLVIEWLMMNHPHDCPVCDEGGHCLLQDLTVAGGHGQRRFLGRKRTYRDQDLGVFVRHEMNRCIHCFRCRRFYQEFAGYRDFGALQIANHTYFGRFEDGPLESPFAGNLIDLCPTGVLTDKPSRYRGRRWDFERLPSRCLHCSLGCRLIVSARYREVVRLEAGYHPEVNGYFICDRGRYGFYFNQLTRRPRVPKIRGKEVTAEEALRHGAEKLSQIAYQFGTTAIAGLGSSRSVLQSQAMLKIFCRRRGWPEPVFFPEHQQQETVCRAVSRLDDSLVISLAEIEQSDCVLVIGADPLQEAPMLALALRQACQKGATVTVIDPRPVRLPCTFRHIPAGPAAMEALLAFLIHRTARADGSEEENKSESHRFDPKGNPLLEEAATRLNRSCRPVIICGTDIVRPSTPDLAADLALRLQTRVGQAGLFFVLPGANAFGAALLSSPESSFLKILEGIEQGTIMALLLVEADPFQGFPDQSRLEEALKKLELLLVMDYLPTRSATEADIFLPVQTLFESGGHLVNQEGRLQWAPPVFCGGTPLSQVNAGSHPPRLFRAYLPGGEARPAWAWLSALEAHLCPGQPPLSPEMLWAELAKGVPVFSRLQGLKAQDEDRRLTSPGKEGPFFYEPKGMDRFPEDSRDDSLELFLVEKTLGTEELSSYSQPVMDAAEAPCLLLSTSLGNRLGLNPKDRVLLELPKGFLEIEIDLAPTMADGVLVLPRHRALTWQKITERPIRLPLTALQKLPEVP